MLLKLINRIRLLSKAMRWTGSMSFPLVCWGPGDVHAGIHGMTLPSISGNIDLPIDGVGLYVQAFPISGCRWRMRHRGADDLSYRPLRIHTFRLLRGSELHHRWQGGAGILSNPVTVNSGDFTGDPLSAYAPGYHPGDASLYGSCLQAEWRGWDGAALT